jgi:hypothetical protein
VIVRAFAGVASLILMIAPHSIAAKELPLRCPPRWGQSGKPLVVTPEAAKSIFLAVERDFFPKADTGQYPDVAATDDGKWWSVARYRLPEKLPNGAVVETFGGGQLSMRIDKCDGRIWHVYFTR